MKNETSFGEVGGREWLTYSHKGQEGNISYPPVRGTHQACFEVINADPEIVPAEGLDLALLTQGAFSQTTPKWSRVRQDCFVSNYVRAPVRVSWMPHSSPLAGAIVERDLKGLGRTIAMNIPADVSGWKKNDSGLYVSPDGNQTFVPEGTYSLGTINEKDGLLIAYLGQEGAEIFTRTAKDSKQVPYSWGLDVKGLTKSEQRVVSLDSNGVRLFVIGDYWGDYDYGYAFGVRKKILEGQK